MYIIHGLLGFRDLQNYTTLKPHYVQSLLQHRFRDLQNYTTLKRPSHPKDVEYGFRDLQNYTTLKLVFSHCV